MSLRTFMLFKFIFLLLILAISLNHQFNLVEYEQLNLVTLVSIAVLLLLEYFDRVTFIKKMENLENNIDSIEKESYKNKLKNTLDTEFLEIYRKINKMIDLIKRLYDENNSLKNDISKWNEKLEEQVLKKAELLNKAVIENKELIDQNKDLNEMTKIDGLTKLFNHEYAYSRLAEEILIAKRSKLSLSIILFDIDHFKNINDTYGHQVGDEVLVQVSEALRDATREMDVVARYGGEEFLAILPDTNRNGAIILANRIRERISNIIFDVEGLHVTISGGIAEWAGDGALKLVSLADELLYKAKDNGRNRIEHL